MSGALVVNIGTLTATGSKVRMAAVAGARTPAALVLDPVGVGATVFRRETTSALMAQAPTIVRGNASEILALAGRRRRRQGRRQHRRLGGTPPRRPSDLRRPPAPWPRR